MSHKSLQIRIEIFYRGKVITHNLKYFNLFEQLTHLSSPFTPFLCCNSQWHHVITGKSSNNWKLESRTFSCFYGRWWSRIEGETCNGSCGETCNRKWCRLSESRFAQLFGSFGEPRDYRECDKEFAQIWGWKLWSTWILWDSWCAFGIGRSTREIYEYGGSCCVFVCIFNDC